MDKLIDYIHDAVIVTDLNSTIIQWNKGAERQLGYTSEEAIGRPVYFLYPEERKKFSQRELISTMKKKGMLDFEAVMRKKSGEEIIVHTSLSTVTDAEQNIVGVISYTLDITKQKKAEALQREKERIQRDLDIASSIQQGLLPSEPPHAEGFQFAGWNEAADQTGGDYFDWLELPDGRIVVCIADVSGHGIGPALIVAVCRAYFRAITDIQSTLNSIMSRVNKLICDDLSSGRFIAAAVGILEPAHKLMYLYSAGHAPIFFYDASQNEVCLWGADDPPLGIVSDQTLNQPKTVKFETGDILVLVTDGFFEWANKEGERFGTVRIKDAISKHSDLSPREIIMTLHKEVKSFSCGTTQMDDLTAVVIKRV